jgi:hypothetical protein
MGIAYTLGQLAHIDMAKHRTAAAAAGFREALGLLAARRDRRGVAGYLEILAHFLTKRGDFLRGCRLFGASDTLREKIGVSRSASGATQFDSRIQNVRLALGEEAFSAAWDEGCALSLEEAVAYAQADES